MELPPRTGARKPARRAGHGLRTADAERTQAAAPREQRSIALGVVMGTHGVRGALRVKLHNPESRLLFELDALQLRAADRLRHYALAEVRAGGKGLLVQLTGVDTLEAAQALRGAELCVARSQLPELPDGEFYHCDLEGLPLVDQDGNLLGSVEAVHEYPAANVLRVRCERGLLEVPLRAPYLLEIDLAGGRIVADQLEDLEPERA